MKKCARCGAECTDDAVECPGCGATDFTESGATLPGDQPTPPRHAIPPLPDDQKEHELVTLLICRTLAEADFIVSDLKGAAIEALVPDQFMIEAGSYRVQVAPKDHEAARQLLNGEG
jgi:hypothetical protein